MNKTKKAKPELIIVSEPTLSDVVLDSITSVSSHIKRCKKGTRKFKKLGSGCFTNEEIANYKLKYEHPRKKTKKLIEEPSPAIFLEKEFSKITNSKSKSTSSKKPSSLKKTISLKKTSEVSVMDNPKRYNEEFIDLLGKLNSIMLKKGEPFREIGRAHV